MRPYRWAGEKREVGIQRVLWCVEPLLVRCRLSAREAAHMCAPPFLIHSRVAAAEGRANARSPSVR